MPTPQTQGAREYVVEGVRNHRALGTGVVSVAVVAGPAAHQCRSLNIKSYGVEQINDRIGCSPRISGNPFCLFKYPPYDDNSPRNMTGAIIKYWEARARLVCDWMEDCLSRVGRAHRVDAGVQCIQRRILRHRLWRRLIYSTGPEHANQNLSATTEPESVSVVLRCSYRPKSSAV